MPLLENHLKPVEGCSSIESEVSEVEAIHEVHMNLIPPQSKNETENEMFFLCFRNPKSAATSNCNSFMVL